MHPTRRPFCASQAPFRPSPGGGKSVHTRLQSPAPRCKKLIRLCTKKMAFARMTFIPSTYHVDILASLHADKIPDFGFSQPVLVPPDLLAYRFHASKNKSLEFYTRLIYYYYI